MSLALRRHPLPDEIERWTPTRKLQVLNDYDAAGDEARAALLVKHGLSTDEIDQWRDAYRARGLAGLQISNQENRR